ncbi:hypothetical protein [Povalibacter sp.]|uniref:hypothetical protein n=1 Tax=Povalibacter sp. TaxID=1962978 RepID=UPI002F407BDA
MTRQSLLRSNRLVQRLALAIALLLPGFASPAGVDACRAAADAVTCLGTVARIPLVDRTICPRHEQQDLATAENQLEADTDARDAARLRLVEERLREGPPSADPTIYPDLEDRLDAARTHVAADTALEVELTPSGKTTTCRDLPATDPINPQDIIEVIFDSPGDRLQVLQRAREARRTITIESSRPELQRAIPAKIVNVVTVVQADGTIVRAHAKLDDTTTALLDGDTVIVRIPLP